MTTITIPRETFDQMREALKQALYVLQVPIVSCQKGVVKNCKCRHCVIERGDATLSAAKAVQPQAQAINWEELALWWESGAEQWDGLKDIVTRMIIAHPQASEPVGPSGDALSDFKADQWWLSELDAAVANGTHDQKRAVAVVRNMLATAEASSEPEWMPIETAPKGANGYSWMYLAWGPDDDKITGSGLHADGKFYAAATFYRLGESRLYRFREIEVKPTHWMPLPAAPEATK